MASILVVDDDETLRKGLYDILLQEGYAVTMAEDGQVALERLKAAPFDLVVLDIYMPRIDGYKVLKTIKQSHPTVRVIMVTGHADLTQAMKSKRLGADDFIGKPFDVEDVLMSVRRSLDHA